MILHIITGLETGGAENALKKLLLSDPGLGCDQAVISLTGLGVVGQELRSKGVNVQFVSMSGFFHSLFGVFRLYQMIRKIKPNIVQTWLYHGDLIGGIVAKVARVQYVVWGIRTTYLKDRAYATSLVRKILAWLSYIVPNKIICVAEAARRSHIDVGYCQEKMIVIGNGFDLAVLEQASSGVRRGDNRGGITVGSVGRFSQDKAQDVFIRAAALLVAHNSEIHFIMAGRGLSRENTELMKLLNQFGLVDRFTLLGEVSNVAECMSRMDVFCLHSRTEGFPNVLGEAMALGVPCVATNVGDVKEILSGTGVLVETCSPEDVAAGLMSMLAKPDTEKVLLGAMAKRRIETTYSLENSVGRYKNLYVKMVDRGMG